VTLIGIHLLGGLSACNVVAGGFAAFQPVYSAGDLARDHRGASFATAKSGCVEVALAVTGRSTREVLEWRMGNPCNEAAPVDLGKLRVTAQSAAGASRVKLYDPNDEIHAHSLAPRREGFDRFRLEMDDASATTLCFDVSEVVGSGAPLCFESTGGQWKARPRGS